MFNNVALDIVIGLVFIYLLYSLLATVLAELIATTIGLRAKNLREAVDRMLNDDDGDDKGLWERIWDSINIVKRQKSLMVKNFYNHPEIKYLGSSGIFKNPSSFKAVSFSKTIIYLLSGEKQEDKAAIEQRLTQLHESPEKLSDEEIILDKETAKYVRTLWKESYGDVVKFRLHLETWFDRTMEQALEWYKRKIQIVLLVIGFFIAWFAGADTFIIAQKLSTDRDAREKMVEMASAYIQNNPRPLNNSSVFDTSDLSKRVDTLLAVKKQLEKDIADANSILGISGWLPDSVSYFIDQSGARRYLPQVDEEIFRNLELDAEQENPATMKIGISTSQKLAYFFQLFPRHFLGFFITALAISLGAPFWFDLLNKLMKLRTSVKQPIRSPHNSTETNDGRLSPLNREA